MAKLKIQAPNGKTLLVDVGDADKAEYDDLATAAVDDYMSKQAPQSIAEQNIAGLDGQGPLDELMGSGRTALDLADKAGKYVKAGFGGTADLVSGNGLDTVVSNIGRIEEGKDATTPAANLGAAIGSQFTPEQIAMMAALGKVGDIIGPWVGRLMKGWAADAAVAAVGKIKSIAKALGVTNLDAVGKFLLTPISIGGKEFEPIISATSSPEEMLNAAKAVRNAAGKQLGVVSTAVDNAVKGITDESGMTVNVSDSILDMNTLTKNIEALKQEAVGDLPKLGKKVATQFDDAISDLEAFAKKQAEGNTSTAFSDLSTIKTKIGNLVYKHGSPLESKAALNDVYHAISDALDSAASKIGGEHGANYAQANQVYHQAMAIVEALEGKVVDAKKLFDAPAFLMALSTGLTTMGAGHGVLAGPAALAGYGASRLIEKYGPQAVAKGLNVGAPVVSKGIQVASRALPVIGNAIVQGLKSGNEEE